MKIDQLIRNLILALLLAGWSSVIAAQADVTTHSEATLFNVQINPLAGSLNWLTDWEIDSAASSFESSAGFSSAYDEDVDFNGETNATASSTAQITTSTSGSTNTLVLSANSDTEIDDATDVFVVNFSASTLYREFEITGGSGGVDVQFSFDLILKMKTRSIQFIEG